MAIWANWSKGGKGIVYNLIKNRNLEDKDVQNALINFWEMNNITSDNPIIESSAPTAC